MLIKDRVSDPHSQGIYYNEEKDPNFLSTEDKTPNMRALNATQEQKDFISPSTQHKTSPSIQFTTHQKTQSKDAAATYNQFKAQ